MTQKKIDDVANMWEKTKDPKYKDLWYKYIKEWVNGPHNIKRWNVSISSHHKADDGTYVFVGRRTKPVRSMRHTKVKTDNVS
jgi:hypothetical protein